MLSLYTNESFSGFHSRVMSITLLIFQNVVADHEPAECKITEKLQIEKIFLSQNLDITGISTKFTLNMTSHASRRTAHPGRSSIFMDYTKRPLTLQEQVDKLRNRGLLIDDEQLAQTFRHLFSVIKQILGTFCGKTQNL